MTHRPLRLLLIEDSADDAGLIERALERGGYDVHSSVVDSEATLRKALGSAEYDLAITDHELGGFDSTGVLATAGELAPGMPCLLVSGKVGEEVVGRAMRLGAIDYVAKDNLGHLPTAVERILAERELRIERTAAEAALARSGQLFEAVFVNARDAMAIVDGERRFLNVNPAACELVAMSREELLNRKLDDLIPHDMRLHTARAWSVFLSDGQQRGEIELLSGSGSLVATEFTAAANFLPDRHIMVIRDIRERRAAEANIERRRAQQKAIAQLGELALREKNLDLLADAVVERVGETLEVEIVSIHEANKERGFVVRSQVGLGEGRAGRRTPPGPPESSQVAFTASQEAPVLVEDCANEPRFAATPVLAGLGVRSSLTVPILDGERPFGVLGVASLKPGDFNDDDLTFLAGVANLLSDAWERNLNEEAALDRSLHDALTGLPNRSLFFDRLSLALARCKRGNTRLAVIVLDIDQFKVLNDTLGHLAADQALIEFSERITDATRETDTLARLGGDEFIVLCEDVAGEEEAEVMVARLVGALEAPLVVEGSPFKLSASIGGALSDAQHQDGDSLLRDAVVALGEAKKHGRGSWMLATEEMRLAAKARIENTARLERAIEKDELVLHYQPIVALDGGGLSGVEALVRWEDPDRGMVPPGEFIPLAEESGLILRIGEWVLRSACRQAAQWRAEYGDAAPLPLHVNFAARQIAQVGLPAIVSKVLSEAGVPPGDIAVEVTETDLIENVGAPIATLGELHDAGMKVALDDFGTGYSSLSYLERFPVDALKIDRTFISRLGGPDAPTAIVAAITGMARALGLETVAEGVENVEEASAVSALGASHAQGYFFGRPGPAGQIDTLVRDDEALRERVAEANSFAAVIAEA